MKSDIFHMEDSRTSNDFYPLLLVTLLLSHDYNMLLDQSVLRLNECLSESGRREILAKKAKIKSAKRTSTASWED